MKNSFLPKLSLSVIAVLLPAFAGQPMSIEVPFDFHVGDTRMAAGEYDVKFITPAAIAVQRADRKQSKIFMTNGKFAWKAPAAAKLVFTRYGEQYFLSQVWSPGSSTGRELTKSPAELEVARRAHRGGNEVAVRATR